MSAILLTLLTMSVWCQVAVRVYAALWLLSGLAWGAWHVLALYSWIELPPPPGEFVSQFFATLEKRAEKWFPHARILDEQDT